LDFSGIKPALFFNAEHNQQQRPAADEKRPLTALDGESYEQFAQIQYTKPAGTKEMEWARIPN